MEGSHPNPYTKEKLGEEIIDLWQESVDVLASICGVPSGLIMRVDGSKIEVFTSSKTEETPYKPGDNEEYLGSGLYCEWVVKNEKQLLVPDATKNSDWADNPDIKLNMISYLGMPIMRPDGKVFGTICILDKKENPYNDIFIKLVAKFKALAELTLKQIHSVEEIIEKDNFIQKLEKIYPICSYCKKIRTEDDEWMPVEKYIKDVTGHVSSHGVCPACYDIEMANID
jgi:GAF domain-containing protein